MSGDKPPSVETVRGPYPTYVEQKSTGKVVPVVQAYCFSKYVGSFDLYFDSDGDLKTPVDGSGVNVTKTSCSSLTLPTISFVTNLYRLV
jgi:hypothetical protein